MNRKDEPRGLREGFGSLAAPDTPMIMRDCIAERYVDTLSPATLFNAAGRIADDLKRRAFDQDWASQLIMDHATANLRTPKPAHLRQIEQAVSWVYNEQEHGLTCTGVLNREGLCFVKQRRCRFHEEELRILERRKACQPTGLPSEWKTYLAGATPGTAYYARWAYLELESIENERGLPAGDPEVPIFISYRALASKVRSARRTPGFNHTVAVEVIRLLEDVGLIKTVVKGKSGVRSKKANGYIRVLPFPPPPVILMPNESSEGVPVRAAETSSRQYPPNKTHV